MTVSTGYSTQQIIPQLVAQAEVLLQQMTPITMKANADSLINQPLLLKPLNNNSLLATIKSGAADAIVLSTTRLAAPANNGSEQFRVNINIANQTFQLITKAPIAVGSRIQLSISQDNLATILSIAKPGSVTAQGSTMSGGQTLASNGITTLMTSTLAQTTRAGEQLNQTSTSELKPTFNQASMNLSIIEQGLRQALPQQQPLKNLLPLLITINRQPPAEWPTQLTQQIAQLLKQFPTPAQLQQPATLKQSISNSGIFLEAKLAELSAGPPSRAKGSTSSNPAVANNALNRDINALMRQIITLTEKPAALKVTAQPAATDASIASRSSLTSPLPGALALSSGSGDPADTTKPHSLFQTPFFEAAINSAPTLSASAPKNEKNADVLLRQLSSQLLASLAKTQLNQLETLATRQQNTPDNQGPVNSWTIEIPIVHGKQIDNLNMQIEQQLVDKDGAHPGDSKKKLWTVMLAFDLHALGKMNIQLKVIEKSVSATVWSQLENTHREVLREITGLKTNLEKIGVNVKHVDCQLGLPPKQNIPIYKQLVDIRT